MAATALGQSKGQQGIGLVVEPPPFILAARPAASGQHPPSIRLREPDHAGESQALGSYWANRRLVLGGQKRGRDQAAIRLTAVPRPPEQFPAAILVSAIPAQAPGAPLHCPPLSATVPGDDHEPLSTTVNYYSLLPWYCQVATFPFFSPARVRVPSESEKPASEFAG